MANYNSFSEWIRKKFPYRVQKISIDAGFSCPNRDGRISSGGCSFCDNRSFNPSYCNRTLSITRQIEEGKNFFSSKYPDMKYIAYFQAYSNTYAPVDELRRKYEEVLSCENIVGIVIGTRPDCISEEILNYLEKLNRQTFLTVEYGIESTNDNTLKRINRGHNFGCSIKAIADTATRGITTGGHVIIGLPGESADDIAKQAEMISATKLNILKIHQLQIIRGTRLADEYTKEPFHIFSADEYIETVAKYIQHLRKDLILERFVSQSPKSMLLAPDWGLKNYEFTNKFNNYLNNHNIRQGQALE